MKPGECKEKTLSGFKRSKSFLPFFLMIIILLLLFSSFPAFGGNHPIGKNKGTKLRDDWVKGDGVHYLGLNPPTPGNNNSKLGFRHLGRR